ncbi:hypothetical protein [Gordonia soli]|uniref:Uncharacterized protein n=1 Tax=Gordonia soli NBRC 108243 TaxID=1223545 RepID=M0QFB6_9ACTN|nr:hypothetical protein [Gordonia soli]GAC67149.1 hypothetical protein GS4_05_03630 [Gordonia soli NBRC 108243]
MQNWNLVFGLGLAAATVAVIAYVRYRSRETAVLHRDTDLARSLRELAGDDAVRLAAIDEFELSVFQRLFYASVIGPRLRSAAWALLGAVLATAGALVTGGDGLVQSTAHIAAIILAIAFAVGALAFGALAIYHAATTPRVSFADSYAEAESDDD